MTTISAAGRSTPCARCRALKRRTVTGGTLAGTLAFLEIPWGFSDTVMHVADPAAHGIAYVAGVAFAVDIAIASVKRARKWLNRRVFVVHHFHDADEEDRP